MLHISAFKFKVDIPKMCSVVWWLCLNGDEIILCSIVLVNNVYVLHILFSILWMNTHRENYYKCGMNAEWHHNKYFLLHTRSLSICPTCCMRFLIPFLTISGSTSIMTSTDFSRSIWSWPENVFPLLLYNISYTTLQ